MTRHHVVIIGAGVGGLALAGTLTRHSDCRVTVLERAPELRARGLGLTIWPNATAAMRKAGFLEYAEKVSEPISRTTVSTNKGRLLTTVDMAGFAARAGFPLLCVTRPELLQALADASGVDVRFGAEVVRVTPDGTVELVGGETLRGDVVVGADGANSTVRDFLRTPQPGDDLTWRTIGWQGVVPRALHGIEMRLIFGPTGAAGTLGLPGNRTYWFVQAPNGHTGREPLPDTASWAPVIREVVAETAPELVWRDGFQDRPPVAGWGRGRVTLLGDAAHTMLPSLGQGACMAIEDAVLLGLKLSSAEDPVAALRAYEAARHPRVHKMYLTARRAARMQRTNPAIRDRVLALVPRAFGRVITDQGRPIPELVP
ncbi:FAD-dependent oxidoreductase [Streptomyces sp. NPDC018031]|uniref:FAD-dependent oxidoreductase n=1 Tax=Streptomyces sp. NPDC018031 TaxID=3365033 RepID=UPI0037A92933